MVLTMGLNIFFYDLPDHRLSANYGRSLTRTHPGCTRDIECWCAENGIVFLRSTFNYMIFVPPQENTEAAFMFTALRWL